MRVFLRNKQTRLYCAASNRWAVALAEALPFTNVRQAAMFAFDEKLPEVEIVVRCDLFEEEVTVPLVPEWCHLEQPDTAAA